MSKANICLCEGGGKEKGVFGRRGKWLSQKGPRP